MDEHVDKEIQTFLKDYPQLRVDRSKGKICCCLTGHEMPIKIEAVRSYVLGKKFIRISQHREYDFKQYLPHLVPNTKRKMEDTMFCMLTYRCVTKQPADIERHVKGKRYQRALKRWQKCQKTGEKFVPRGRQFRKVAEPEESVRERKSRKSKDFWEPEVDCATSENDTDSDDLADFYPSDESDMSEEERIKDEVDSEDNEDSGNKFINGDGDNDTRNTDKDLRNIAAKTSTKQPQTRKDGGKQKKNKRKAVASPPKQIKIEKKMKIE